MYGLMKNVALRKTSEFEGELKDQSHEFNGTIKMARFMNRTNSILFAVAYRKWQYC